MEAFPLWIRVQVGVPPQINALLARETAIPIQIVCQVSSAGKGTNRLT